MLVRVWHSPKCFYGSYTWLLILQEKGVDTIACVAVNDAFVMDAWGKSVGADGKILLLADGSALFTKVMAATIKHRPLLGVDPTSGCCLIEQHNLCQVRAASVTDLKCAQAIGVDLDLVEKGLGVRSRRYAMLVDDGTVTLELAPTGCARSGKITDQRLTMRIDA